MNKSQKLFLILILKVGFISAQMDTIYLTPEKLKMDQLQEGRLEYLTYFQQPNGTLLDASIWDRKTELKKVDGVERIVITQQWKNQNKERTRSIYSICNSNNFLPIYHKASNGKEENEAYNFKSDKILGADSLENNTKSDFDLALEKPTFNWELDMEMLSVLPYAEDAVFLINFYHPGSKSEPKDYAYSVIGKEPLQMPNGASSNCWLLNIKYSAQNQATFWIDTETFKVLKMKEEAGPLSRYKILLY